MLFSLNAIISTYESTQIITGHVIYNPAYMYLQIPIENHHRPKKCHFATLLGSKNLGYTEISKDSFQNILKGEHDFGYGNTSYGVFEGGIRN